MRSGRRSSWRYRCAIVLALLFVVAGAAPQARGAGLAAPLFPAAAEAACLPQLSPAGSSTPAQVKDCPPQPPAASPIGPYASLTPIRQRIPGGSSAAARFAGRQPTPSEQPFPLAPAAGGAQPAGQLSEAGQWSARTCSKTQNSWTTTSEIFVPITTCTITIPITGTVYLNASASAGLVPNTGKAFLARFQLAVDDARLPSSDRYVDVNTDSGDGTDENLASQAVATLGPGEHTISLFGTLAAGDGPVQLYRATITAIYALPSGDMRICGSPEVATWQPSGAEPYQPISSCSLTLPITGTVFLSASTAQSVAVSGQAYTGNYALGVDSSFKNFAYVDVYPGVGSGASRTVALQIGVTVGPGAHTFTLFGGKFDGAGPMQITQPSIAAVYLPQPPGGPARGCAAVNGQWTTTSTTMQMASWCTMTVPITSTIYLATTTTARLDQGGQPFEAELLLGINGIYRDDSRRWINTYADARDGTDKTVATQFTVTVIPGTYTFMFGAKKYGGAGPVALINTTVSAIVLGPGEPTVSALPDQHVYLGQTVGPLKVEIDTINGSVGGLQFGAGSLNRDLIPNVFVYGGSGSSRTFTFTVNPTKSGTATIVYGVSDGTRTFERTFKVIIRYGLMLPVARR